MKTGIFKTQAGSGAIEKNRGSSGRPVKIIFIACLFAAAGALFFSAAAVTPAEAQLGPGGFGDSRGPIAVSSDRLETDDPGGVATFIGAVVARQGEMTITCDVMKIFYITEERETVKAAAGEGGSPFSGSNRQVDRVECEGNVKVVEGDRLAMGKKALYLAHSLPRRIIITGDARVWQGRDSLTGHQVTYMLDEKRSVVESGPSSRSGGGERVRTIFHQGDDK